MLNMAKKNGVGSPREGTASAVREATRSGISETATTPERPKRRTFTAEFKQRIVREAAAARASGTEGAIGELIRREGVFSSQLTNWARESEAGQLDGLTPKPRGRKSRKNPLSEENARLQRDIKKLQHELYKANTIIDVQKKLSFLLGDTLPTKTAEDFARAEQERLRATRRR